jgi:hypothetical protein
VRKKGALLPAKRAFCAENAWQNRRQEGFGTAFSFREMSDFKALERIFLPAPLKSPEANGQSTLRAASPA